MKYKPNDLIDFEYYTESDVVIGSGKIIWINDHDCVIEEKNGKRHQMQINCISSL